MSKFLKNVVDNSVEISTQYETSMYSKSNFFPPEKLNITVINDNYSGLPSIEEEEAIHKAQEDNKELLGIPRR